MPKRKKGTLGKKAKAAKKIKKNRENESETSTNIRLASQRERQEAHRATESKAQHSARLASQRERQEAHRATESKAQHTARLASQRERQEACRDMESEDQHIARITNQRMRQEVQRATESEDQQIARRTSDRDRHAAQRDAESEDQQIARRANDSAQHATSRTRQRQNTMTMWQRAAFAYDSSLAYADCPDVCIGGMTQTCPYCAAKKWKGETPGLCCSGGKVKLPELPELPEILQDLLTNDSCDGKHFRSHIFKYNSAFQMTSFGTDNNLTDRGFFTTFRVQGQVYHRIGGLLPLPDQEAKFVQVFFMQDADAQVQQRLANMNGGLKENIVLDLQEMLHERHQHVHNFKYALEKMNTAEHAVVIHADRCPQGEHLRRYNAPTTNEVAIILLHEEHGKRDIVLQKRDGFLKRVSETHRAYDSLQYPLMFPHGSDGYCLNILQAGSTTKKVSCKQYYSYRLMIRSDTFNTLHHFKQIFAQFLVDTFAKMETERLLFIKLNQKQLRADDYIHLRDAVAADGDGTDVGQRVILPSSFTGSPRFYHAKTQDAMSYVRKFGRPDLFLTYTCNPKVQEIANELFPGQTPTDRHDIICRVFHEKIKKLLFLLKEGQIFGELVAWIYSIEYQKRGLPHMHCLLWCKQKIRACEIDSIISAELPNPTEDPELFAIVKTQLIHGPCGNINPASPCMSDKICTKKYPRQFLQATETGDDGYPSYRRRSPDDGGFSTKLAIRGQRGEQVVVDNRWVVPHSPILCKIFKSHINLELCNSVKSIKYVCKYIHKGSDMAVFNVQNKNDEVTTFQTGRYISSTEAAWRIFGHDIHQRYPPVVNLAVHLENGQRVFYTEHNAREIAANPPETTLTAFFKLCNHDNFARTLLYADVPTYYTWGTDKKWKRRKNGKLVQEGIFASSAIGRVYTVHPNNQEAFYLRLLLHRVKGPTRFADLRTFDGEICSSYREACLKHGLLEDDRHWQSTMDEAACVQMPSQLRQLFAILLQSCQISNPLDIWMRHRDFLAEDFLHTARQNANNMELTFTDGIYNQALLDLESRVIAMGGTDLKNLPKPQHTAEEYLAQEYLQECNYDVLALTAYVEQNKHKMTDDQRQIFQRVMQSVNNDKGEMFFLDAPGGTGKTYVTNLLLANVRKENAIAIAVASSGIAATLLDGGRTAHSAFKLPLDLNMQDEPMCNIKRGTAKARVLKDAKLIIWDEATMSHRKGFESLDRTLQDIREDQRHFGGITLLLCGDFRQTLPVVPQGTRADEVKACIKSSYLWSKVQKLSLHTNMRLYIHGDVETETFANQLLSVGNDAIPQDAGGNIAIPVGHKVANLQGLIESVYPKLQENYRTATWFMERSILAPKNATVNEINKLLLQRLPGGARTYASVDSMPDPEESVQYPTEFLNSLEPAGMPSHLLQLKKFAPVMLLRNLDAPVLCNGTRLIILQMLSHVLEAQILGGKFHGKTVFIPRIPLVPSDSRLPFKFRRLQFPVKPSFAMTVNKSQGQTISILGLELTEPPFSHGQLYVGLSRACKSQNIYILAEIPGKTKNVVYREVL